MNNIVNQIQSLYEQELYTNVIRVCEIALSSGQQKHEFLTPVNHLNIILYHADALYHIQQYPQAEKFYREALLIHRKIIKTKTPTNNKQNNSENSQINLSSEVDIRYKIYLCCMALKQKKSAADILQHCSPKLRTAKINMALGNLLVEFGVERQAVTCFKEVLKESPLALEAIENLLKLGIKGVEVNSLVVGVSSEISWLSIWIKAQAEFSARDFTNAIQTYKSMDMNGMLKDNPSLVVNMAYCYAYLCDDLKAIGLLQRALRHDINLLFGRDLLSTLLAKSNNKEHLRYLETITPTNDMSLWASEHWVVLGNFMYATKKFEKAVYFGQQACLLNQRNVEAFILKANALFQLKMYQEAITHCTEGLQLCSFRYDLHKCMVECYLQSHKLREAESAAQTACKELNHSPQSYMLQASVLLKDPLASNKSVHKTLEKVMALDKTGCTNALCSFVELLEQEQQYDRAIQLLLKFVEQNPTSKLYELLGDCYVNVSKDDDAFQYYTLALKLDPTNQRAIEGISLIGRNVSLNKRDSYYTAGESSYTPQGTTASDHDADQESDTDIWHTGNDIIRNFD